MELAQTRQNNSISHTCQTTHQMNKGTNVDFAGILAGDEKYTDNRFHYSDALYWADLDPWPSVESSSWKRVSEVFDETYTMWGNEGIHPRDME